MNKYVFKLPPPKKKIENLFLKRVILDHRTQPRSFSSSLPRNYSDHPPPVPPHQGFLIPPSPPPRPHSRHNPGRSHSRPENQVPRTSSARTNSEQVIYRPESSRTNYRFDSSHQYNDHVIHRSSSVRRSSDKESRNQDPGHRTNLQEQSQARSDQRSCEERRLNEHPVHPVHPVKRKSSRKGE